MFVGIKGFDRDCLIKLLLALAIQRYRVEESS